MEVSAKTGSNIKEFFKEMACVIAGAKKTKDEPTPKTQTAAQPKPAAQSNNISLEAAGKGDKEGRKNKKCECWWYVPIIMMEEGKGLVYP